MKNAFIFLVSMILLISCENGQDKPGDGNPVSDTNSAATILRIGDNISFDYGEILLYDSSSHVLIFNNIHPEFEKLKDVPFEMCSNGDAVYQGHFWPAYLSSLPDGPYIMNNPLALQNFALKIDFMSLNNKPDPRNDLRFINTLKDHNLLQAGLSVRIRKIESTGSLLSFNFTVTNMDKNELLILDPDEMGINLFHYFTNGLVIRNLSSGIVTNATVTPKTPVPLNGFQSAWLANLSPGATRSYTFLYSLKTPLNPGEYMVTFLYPGLTSQVDILNLFQKGTRIWLGDATTSAKLTVH
ncbi:MAG: hypothetical protein ACM3UT_02875 [Chloroflexota bacterium]